MVRVVTPPWLEELRVTVAPPAYTGAPQRDLPAGAAEVEVPAGSRMLVAARANEPLVRAWIAVDDVVTSSPP